MSNQNFSFLKEIKGAGSSWPGKNSWAFLLIPLFGKLGKFSSKVGEKRDISCILQAPSSYLISIPQYYRGKYQVGYCEYPGPH